MTLSATKLSITAAAALSCAWLGLTLTGCGLGVQGTNAPVPVKITGGQVSGTFMGGQQPVAGVSIQMYQTGTAGYGSAATALFTAGSVKTTPSGNFTLPTFSCTSGTKLYLVGTGGTPIGGSANANLALMTGLGPCETFSGSNFINVNELTTVAAVYALSPFMTGITNVGVGATNALGLTNAFATINKLVDTTNGTAPGPAIPGNATLPIQQMNALADILQNCVNSAGGSAGDTTDGLTNGTPCGKLFYLTNVTGTAPTDTITAAMNIAQHPANNVAKLNNNQSASPAFSPTVSVNSPPNAWTLAVTYTGGGLSSPSALATDASGSIWIANKGNSSVTELSNTGAPLSPAAGYTAGNINAPSAIILDQNGLPWVANANNSITKLAANGTSGTTYSNNGLNAPAGIAIDSADNVWVANSGSGGGVSAFTNAGAALAGSPYTGGGASAPAGIAISGK